MKRLLVIEDNMEVRENLCEILELSGYAVQNAENGKTGVQKALESPPDLILCDVMMPELDGFGVLRILSKNPKTFDVPFIFLTAKAEKTDFRKGMNLGADDYITKPFDDVELLDAIEIRLQKKSQARQSANDGSASSLRAFIDEAKGKAALEKLSSKSELHHYKKKEILYREGDFPNKVFYLNQGKVKIYKTNDWGKEYITEIHTEGDFLGYLPLMTDSAYQDSAAVLEDAQLSFIPREDFLNLLHSNRDLSARFIRMLANDVETKEEQLLRLAYNSIRKRVAQTLVDLHQSYEPKSDQIAIQREDLANLVGTAKESVIRTLGDFKSEGLISIEKGGIVILKLEALSNLPG